MSGRSRRRLARRLAVLALALLPLAALADWRTPPRGEGPDQVRVRRIEGADYVAVNDLARLLDATKYWRAEVLRLELRSGSHVVALTADAPFAVVDDATVWLGAPVRVEGGEFQVPVTLVAHLPADRDWPRLFHDERRARILVLSPSGSVGSPRVVVAPGATRVVVPADRPDEAVVVARSRGHFRIRFGGLFTGALPDSLPADGLVRALKPIGVAGGSAFEATIDRAAAGWRLVPEPARRHVTLEFAPDAEGREPFAPEDPAGPRRVRVIVLDPGHGGADFGTRVQDVREKDLTLALAQVLAADLERRLGARVLLTRGDDSAPTADLRAEIANRARADLVLSLHFDGFASARARGATAYCPPATYASADESGGSPAPAATARLLPWRDVGLRHAVQARALAEAVLSSLELAGQGPTRLRERLPSSLLGVNAPGILLECATLTSPGDRERVTQEEGLRQLAAAITDGVVAWQRNE